MNRAICLICLTPKPYKDCEFIRLFGWAHDKLVCVDCAIKLNRAPEEEEEPWEHG